METLPSSFLMILCMVLCALVGGAIGFIESVNIRDGRRVSAGSLIPCEATPSPVESVNRTMTLR